MQDNQAMNKARALYYNLFANFFVTSKDTANYFELLRLINILKENPLNPSSGQALENILNMLDPTSNVVLLQEFDDLFHNPITKKVRLTASFYDEGLESGKKRLEMINFLAKTKLRRDEKNYYEYEDSVGFIFSLMAELTDLISQGEVEYENTVHCIFEQILNSFIDEVARELYEHDNAVIFKELMIVLHSFIEFERLFLEVSKPELKPKNEITTASCGIEEEISEEERERRARNKALKALGPKKDETPKDTHFDVEEDF